MPVFLGIDIGSTTSKAVAVDQTGAILATALVPTGAHGTQAADAVRADVLRTFDDAHVAACVATGYGRARVPFADRTITEITCHARAVAAWDHAARTVLDIGGQDAKTIRLAPDGSVDDFAMNDRCAAGTGSFLDMVTRRFGVSFEELSATDVSDPVEISATCVVFAESEVVGLLADGVPLARVLAGIHHAVARRIAAMLEQIRAVGPVAFTGGVARNDSLRRAIETESKLEIRTAPQPQFAGAFGAALLARGT